MKTRTGRIILAFLLLTLSVVPFVIASCSSSSSEETCMVNIQVTGADYLEPMMEYLDKAGIVATIWLSAEEMNNNCNYISELGRQGNEIAGKYPTQITDETSYDEQKELLLAIMEAAPGCAGQQITGFRATKFTANESTFKLLDEMGIEYLERSARDELLSVFTFRPYAFEGHDFAILPMPIRCAYGETGSLCDTSSKSGGLTPEELRQYMFAAIDNNIKLGEPLLLEWHPIITNPDDTEGWWDTFVAVIDYLEGKGNQVRFVTAHDIVNMYL